MWGKENGLSKTKTRGGSFCATLKKSWLKTVKNKKPLMGGKKGNDFFPENTSQRKGTDVVRAGGGFHQRVRRGEKPVFHRQKTGRKSNKNEKTAREKGGGQPWNWLPKSQDQVGVPGKGRGKPGPAHLWAIVKGGTRISKNRCQNAQKKKQKGGGFVRGKEHEKPPWCTTLKKERKL